MKKYAHILDNHEHTVADYLRESLHTADALRVVSAYFSIYGYDLLAEALDTVGEVRLLFGDPTSVEDLDPGEKEPKSFELTERGLVPNLVLQQKALARLCADWIRRESVSVRSINRANRATQIGQLGIHGQREARLPVQSKSPRSGRDFELVTWLVVLERTG